MTATLRDAWTSDSRIPVSKYGVDWPTEPEAIIREALREFVGDGEGADELVLTDYLDGIAQRIEVAAEYEEVYGCRAMHEAAQIVREYIYG